MKKYEYIEGIVIADAAFDAYGKDLNELFENAALAVTELMVDLKTLKQSATKKFEINAENVEKLLFKFLDQIIFLKDTEQLLFKTFKIKINEKESTLTAECKGDKINREKQKLGTDVKAVTYHNFKVEKIEQGWKARVIVDI
ncbi:archease [Candidatus Woesearchaeota archaeon]|nr:archease [Candidatus Woesearchaeota archaeon]